MKAVILAGGLGSRISEETYLKPKPMVTIGNIPILLHILRYFSDFGIKEFIICLGYKGDVIKEYFLNFKAYSSDFVVKTRDASIQLLNGDSDDWTVTLVDTGLESNTGERLKRVSHLIQDDSFFFTYGDGLTDQNLSDTLKFHQEMNTTVTLTAVYPPARYGAVLINEGLVENFSEKVSAPNSMINGGFFVVNRNVFHILNNFLNPSWEVDVLPWLAQESQLSGFKHSGFWYAMDTVRDKEHLEYLWEKGSPPWGSKSKSG